ncbi:hypothetical protein SCLCIDRAFT_52033, partial [Scleroderma citrinum Foug A]
ELILEAWKTYFKSIRQDLTIGHFTMDNAANNIAAMHELAKLLEEHEILFDPIDRRIPCFPHILNICVTHAVKNFAKADFTAVAETWVGALNNTVVDKAKYLEALAKDPITLGHDIVRIICSSGQLLQDLEVVLEIPHEAQKSMSSESCPTLGGAIPAFEKFMMEWEALATNVPHIVPFVSVGLGWAREYYQWMGQTCAYVIAMFVDPTIRLGWISDHWEQSAATKAREDILELVSTCYCSLPTIRVWLSQPAPQGVDQEFNAYTLATPSPEGMHPLSFWEGARVSFPTIYAITLDYLPIQASAIPCEHVFSSSSDTDIKKRNHISPTLMEALQMLKFWIKKDRLNFMKDWITPQKEMVTNEQSEDLLARLFSTMDISSSLDEVLGAIASIEGDKVSNDTAIF